MWKCFSILCLLCWMAPSVAHDETYYSLNPGVLQKTIERCPDIEPKDITCATLKKLALRVNALADELRLDPQGFGQKILVLEENMAKAVALDTAQQELRERLAIVKWLESPES